MDETPIPFDLPKGYTLNKKGENTIHIKSNGAKRKNLMCILTIQAYVQRITPNLLFKGVRPLGTSCRANPKGWMNVEYCLCEPIFSPENALVPCSQQLLKSYVRPLFLSSHHKGVERRLGDLKNRNTLDPFPIHF